MTKDFSVKITVRNGRLLRKILATHDSVAKFAEAFRLPYGGVVSLVGMRTSPIARGDWSELALNVCGALGVYPEDIWPEHMRAVMKRSSATVDLDLAEVEAITSHESAVDARLLIDRWSAGLTDREKLVVAASARGATLDEMGQELGGLSRERVRQIESKAHRKMRQRALIDGAREYRDICHD